MWKLLIIIILLLSSCATVDEFESIKVYTSSKREGTFKENHYDKSELEALILSISNFNTDLSKVEKLLIENSRNSLSVLIEQIDNKTKAPHPYYRYKSRGGSEVRMLNHTVGRFCFEYFFIILFKTSMFEPDNSLEKRKLIFLYKKGLLKEWYSNRQTLTTEELIKDLESYISQKSNR